MKKIIMLLTIAALVFAPAAFAAEAAMPMGHEQTDRVTVYQCPMDHYTAEKAGTCPLCGMNLEAKEMPMAEAHKAMEDSKTK